MSEVRPVGFPPAPEDPAFPALTAPGTRSLAELDPLVTECRACPRLVAWREDVARVKRSSFQDW
ncbi:MAG TPA: uracil-DNA glycosylase, partial [Streptomyces sp.]